MQDKKEFAKNILEIVSSIPAGSVTTYGTIAVLAGDARQPRYVGRVLKLAGQNSPCHRVVASNGGLVPGWAMQKQLLLQEGISFRPNGTVNMKRHSWK